MTSYSSANQIPLRLMATALGFLSLSQVGLHAADGTWLNTGSIATWSDTGNWVGGVVPGAANTALFNTSVGTVGTLGNPITFSGTTNLSVLTFDTASVGSFFIGATGGGALTMAINSSFAVNSIVTNSQTINAPLILNGSSAKFSLINNAISASALLNIGGTISGNSAASVLTLDGSNTGSNTVSGAFSNGSGTGLSLVKSGVGTWVLTGANTNTGATTIQGGNLVLDFTGVGAPASVLNAASALVLGSSSNFAGSGTLTINGKASASSAQTVGAVTLNNGASHINLNAGGSGTLDLTLGALTASTVQGSSLDFSISSGASVKVGTASLANGLFTNALTINGSDFATNNGNASNALVALSTISGAYDTTSTTISSTLTKPVDVQANITTTNNAIIPGIRFNKQGAYSITLTPTAGKTLTISNGNSAILVTANVGANTTTITGGTISGASNKSLSLIQNNVLGRLQIDSVIGGTSVAKAGAGLAVLTGANTYTGKTFINEGSLQFGKQVALYNNATASWTAANILVGSGATLALNVGGSGEFTTSDVATVSGLGTATGGLLNGSKLGLDTTNAAGGNFTHSTAITNTNGGANVVGLRKLGANTLTLAGANTYTGGTSIEQGTLALSQSFSMGSTSANGIAITNAAGAIAGTDYGQLVFSGTTLTYGGSLNLSLTGTITTSSVFDLVNFASGTGAGNFNSVSISGSYAATLTSSGSTWTGSSNGVNFSFDTVSGDLTATASAVPEPSTVALLMGLGALVVAGVRRRKLG